MQRRKLEKVSEEKKQQSVRKVACVSERDWNSVCVCVRVWERVKERDGDWNSVCVCVWVREKEREKDRDGKRMQNFHLVEFCLGKGNFIFKWLSTKVSLKEKKSVFSLFQ